MRKKILVVSPYSGRRVGGGLSVMNQQLTEALAEAGNDVKLLTLRLPAHSAPDPSEHGGAEILYISNDKLDGMEGPGSRAEEREILYELMNSDAVLLADAVKRLFSGWEPDIIIGHSRFSGPAAIRLKEAWFPQARVEYFLHSFPVEGTLLTGYEAYEEKIDAELAMQKFAREKAWMPRADIVVGVGPLLRIGATMILDQAGAGKTRVHECIPGTELDPAPVAYQPPLGPIDLLMLGRFNVPIKGLEDIVLAALLLRERGNLNVRIRVRGWAKREYEEGRVVDDASVQAWIDGVLNRSPGAEDDKARVEVLPMSSDKDQIREDIRSSHAMLMPSYFEHFGLVPLEVSAHGVPVLVTEISGVGMFLGDASRFPKIGEPCVVRDFDPTKKRPLRPSDFLEEVGADAFDNRPKAWADAIEDLATNLEDRFQSAGLLHEALKRYSWRHCATALVSAAGDGLPRITVQGPGGELLSPEQGTTNRFPIRLGEAAYLTRGLNDTWSPADGRLNALHTPPSPAMETAEVTLPDERGKWGYPVITLHEDPQSLLSALLPYQVVSPSAEIDSTALPTGALVLGAARNAAALATLSKTLGVDLTNPSYRYALVKSTRLDGEVSHRSHPGEVLVYSRPRLPGIYGLTKDFHSAMSRLNPRYGKDAVRKMLDFQRTYGTHYVSKVAVGDTILQVLAYPADRFDRVKKVSAKHPQMMSGVGAADFAYFTTALDDGEFGFVKEFGTILNLSNCQAFQESVAQGKWHEKRWSNRSSIFALFDGASPMRLDVLDQHFQDQAPTMVTLASMGVLIELKRGVYWQRVLKAALAQKYEDSIQVDVRVDDTRDFVSMMPEDMPALVSTLATPKINVYTGRLDLGTMQLMAPDQVQELTILTQVLSSSGSASIDIPGKSVRLFAQVFDLRAKTGVATWTLSDEAFATAELACDEFLGGLALRNRSGTAYSFVLGGMKFGLTGSGREAEPDVVADLRTTPSEKALPALATSLQLAMSFMEAVLGSQCACSSLAAPCPTSEVRDLARTGCEWFARFIPATSAPALLALRVQALGLARHVQDPAYGAFVPILPAEKYEAYVRNVLDYADAIELEIKQQEEKIARRQELERLIDVSKTLNQNIIASGKLLSGIVDASREKEQNLAVHYDSIVKELEAEAKTQSAKADQLQAALFVAKSEVDRCVQVYRTAVERQVISDAVKFALDCSAQLFSLGVAIANPTSAISAVKELGVAVQTIQKVFNVLNAMYTVYSTVSKEVDALQSASKTLDELGDGRFGSTSTLPWDELAIEFKRVMASGPQGDKIKSALPALQAAFDLMILRGKAAMSARSSLNQLQREIYTARWQKELRDDQARRLAALGTSLSPARVEELDRSAVDVVGLTGELHAIQQQMLATLSRAFLLEDQALQYANLQPATPISSFSVLRFKSARAQQEAATIAALSRLAPLVKSTTTPISYVIEGVPVEDIHGGAGFSFTIGVDWAKLSQYVDTRLVSVVAEVDGVTSTQSGLFHVQLDFGGSPFMIRDPRRDCLRFHTPTRGRTYEYKAGTGERCFTDDGKPWSDGVSPITPFSRWTVSLPATATNQGIKFAGPSVTVRLVFVLEARIVDAPAASRRRALPSRRGAAQAPPAAAAPTKEDLVRDMATQGSCTNRWDVVLNMSLKQINEALRKQYDALKADTAYKNTIKTEIRTEVMKGTYAIKRVTLSYGYPVMQFMTNNDDVVQLQMEILGGSTIERCLETNGSITCEPPMAMGGETLTANVKLSKVTGTVSGASVLRVELNMAEGAFTMSNIDLSDDEKLDFNEAVKSYFVNHRVIFLINQLDISRVPTLEALKPHNFLFKALKTPSGVEMLQLFIQTGDRALLDQSQTFLNNVPEPLPSGHECSMMIRSQLFYAEILPRSLAQNGWGMEGVPPSSPNGAWSGKLTSASVTGTVDLSAMTQSSSAFSQSGNGSVTVSTFAPTGGNPVTWSLGGIPIKSTAEGKLRLEGSRKDTMGYVETQTITEYPAGRKSEKTYDLKTDVSVDVWVSMPLEISGSGRDQKITVKTSARGTKISGHLSGGGPCASDDLAAKVNQQIYAQVPSQIESKLNVRCDAISVFALENLLFPSGTYISFTGAYAPGDVLLVGNFVSLS